MKKNTILKIEDLKVNINDKEILKGLKVVQGVDFKAIATQIDYEFGTTGQTQVRMEFD